MNIKVDNKTTICSWQENHIDGLLKHANSNDITKYLGDTFPHPYTKSDADSWIEFNNNLEENLNFAILVNDNCVGGIGIIKSKDIYRKTIEIGYWIGTEFQNKGIISKSVKRFTEYCFNSFDIHRIQAKVFSNNEASKKVLIKCNYIEEAVLKDAIYKNDTFLDLHLFRILKSDF